MSRRPAYKDTGEKQCIDCGKILPLSEFYRAYKDNVRGECKRCNMLRNRRWSEKNMDRSKGHSRKHQLSRYGLTSEDCDRMYEAQNGLCAICNTPGKNGKRLAVDHDHGTGAVRQLLCTSCNMGIGYFRHDTGLLEAALAYLKRNVCG